MFLRMALVAFVAAGMACLWVGANQVWLSPQADHTLLWVISGLVLFAAALLQSGIISESGKKADGEPDKAGDSLLP